MAARGAAPQRRTSCSGFCHSAFCSAGCGGCRLSACSPTAATGCSRAIASALAAACTVRWRRAHHRRLRRPSSESRQLARGRIVGPDVDRVAGIAVVAAPVGIHALAEVLEDVTSAAARRLCVLDDVLERASVSLAALLVLSLIHISEPTRQAEKS